MTANFPVRVQVAFGASTTRFVPEVGVKVSVNGKVFDYSKPFDSAKPYQVVIPDA